ncbi:electron transfer flavoprotein regulatory factor 1 isoform X2 [Thrips palmi]|nr:electron transfer flavoprotein regulatory factor 1 isoform X2 [Thrips palmi]XP_034243553.1 electron transfer flavoprotein regulatory factor 1 isoform X2 [Thrips palmi]
MAHRNRVINLYKSLVHLGHDYPLGWDYFRPRLKAAFMKNKDVKDPEKIEQLIARGNFVVKEIETLYMLKKYRTLKKRYYSSENDLTISEFTKKIESDL